MSLSASTSSTAICTSGNAAESQFTVALRLSGPLGAPGPAFVTDGVWCDQLVGQRQVTVVEDLVPNATGERLVGVERHVRTLQ